jgi:dethiobiotin synthetase
MLKQKIYFIAAIGTDIGKTFLVENLCKNLRQEKKKVRVIKPVVSGFRDADESDSGKILAALELPINKKNLDEISPWRFENPVSPNFAAKMENKKIDFSEVKKFCQKKISEAKKSREFLFIESAGGVMTPITDEKNFLDLASELKIPLLLLTANYLGSISHTLCAVAALKAKKIIIEKIIVNENFTAEKDSGISEKEFSNLIKNLTKIETFLLINII